MATGGDPSLYPVTILTDEMRSEDTEVRINAMRRLRMVAATLGSERTRKELIPFLTESVEDDDEVLLVMAEELGACVDLVGGPSEAVCLMQPLGSLAQVEETVVREKAVESSCVVIRGLDNAAVVEVVLPIVQRLTQGDWFTARVSACGLFAAAYARLTDAAAKTTLRSLYATLCQDDTPMVRRAAAKNIGTLATVVEKEYVLAELLPLFTGLSTDDQDSVRLLAIENCTAFSRIFSVAENNRHILPMVKACAGDKSWRVRNNVAREFFSLSESVGVETTNAELVPLFVKLLQDPEAEVRASAAKNVSGYVSLIGAGRFVTEVLPAVKDLVADPAQNVKTALAESVMDTAAKLGHDAAVSHLIPLIMQFLRDEAAEVRLKVLESLHKVVGTVGAPLLESMILPALLTLGTDALWRVREKVIDQMPLLAESLGAAVFEDKLLPLYLATYQDQVNAVRMAATRCLQPLAKSLGNAWVRSKLVPKLAELYNAEGSSYLQRITVLYGIKNVSTRVDHAEVAGDFTGIALRALRDDVPNVRFVGAQLLAEAIAAGVFDRSRIASDIRPALSALTSDADPDVKYFASVALAAC